MNPKKKEHLSSHQIEHLTCRSGETCCGGIDRRDFVRLIGVGSAAPWHLRSRPAEAIQAKRQRMDWGTDDWPTFKRYESTHTDRIAMPLGGIGTGCVSLGGRGDLRDWEIVNRPAKGFVPSSGDVCPSFILFCRNRNGQKVTRLVEGPVSRQAYEGSHGSRTPNENLPRFRHCSFDTAYPFGRVRLSDPEVPVKVELRAFNPLIPGDADLSGLPVAILTFRLENTERHDIEASLCANLPNFVGVDGWTTERDWKGDRRPSGAKQNRIEFRRSEDFSGLFLFSEDLDELAEQWGTLALLTANSGEITFRTAWDRQQWGNAWLDFWDDFSEDGRLEERELVGSDIPIGSLAVQRTVPAQSVISITLVLAWHFPNRYSWTQDDSGPLAESRIGNYYTTSFLDAWDAGASALRRLPELQSQSARFVEALCASSLPEPIIEAALFNLSTLRTQTCFRTPDGRFFGWEGTADNKGCCFGSCTHVWNYEQSLAFLFGDLARSMREVEFGHATDPTGLMSFRVHLPLRRAQEFGKAAADGQMGCIMKIYRDWQLSGDSLFLRRLWPGVRKALEFCWIEGGWDADRDGVMEGCQHNTMDVEYYGPNPQMGFWYLGALQAAAEMADYLGKRNFARSCRQLFERGRKWIETSLFNGEYFIQEVRPPRDRSEIAPSLLIGMGAKDPTKPEFQLASGCLVDQLVGQFMAHVCGLGYLVDKDQVVRTLRSIKKYNFKKSLYDHFNSMRTFALGEESGLLMASYPEERPENPFPYFSEVMTGFEYTAAIGMLYEGLQAEGLECIQAIRERYDGFKRNPFDEAECGHHYARAMASWASILALSGFKYSGVEKTMEFGAQGGNFFWSNGDVWGTCSINQQGNTADIELRVLKGALRLSKFVLTGVGDHKFDPEEPFTETRFSVQRL